VSWLSKEEKDAIFKAFEEGQRMKAQHSIKGVARRFNVHPRTVQKIVEEKRAQQDAHPMQTLVALGQ
jgi:transposase-like protein